MARNLRGWLPGLVPLVVATVVACWGEPADPPPNPATMPTPTATTATGGGDYTVIQD